MRIISFSFVLTAVLFLTCGCSQIQHAVPDIIKSNARIQLEKKTEELKNAQLQMKALPGTPVSREEQLQAAKTRYELLKAEYEYKIACLEQTSRKSNYFFLGSKGLGIAAGVTSAVLVAASPANAAAVAGLTTFSAGLIALEGSATEMGYSSEISKQIIAQYSEKVAENHSEFKDISWEKLYAIQATAPDKDWNTAMGLLGKQLNQFETAVRYKRFHIEVTTE
ncbi:MAG: hypothetical protein MI747_07025 [Desulfobacterales bacterium]|nr:hypothetical protein [Desulfobacterales bacterium]